MKSSLMTHLRLTTPALVATLAAAGLVGCTGRGGGTFTSLPNPAIVVAAGEGKVVIIDPASLSVASSVPVAAGLHPHHLAASADGSKVLVSATSADLSAGHEGGHAGHGRAGRTGIYLVDVERRELRHALEVEATAHNAAFMPDGRTLVLAMMEHGMVAGYDATSLRQVYSAGGFGGPLEVTPTSRGMVLVAESTTGRVAVFDPGTRTVSDRFDVGPLPVAAWASGGGHFYVSVEHGRQLRHITEGPTGVTMDAHRIDVQGAPAQAMLTPNGAELWVAVEDRGVVAVFAGGTHAKVAEFRAGVKPHGIAFDPSGSRAFVTDEGGARVLVIDVATRSVTQEIPVGGKPNGILWLSR